MGTGHRIVVFFCVSCFAGKWKGKSAARGMDLIDKKGTTVPYYRLSRRELQDQFKIGTRLAAGAGFAFFSHMAGLTNTVFQRPRRGRFI